MQTENFAQLFFPLFVFRGQKESPNCVCIFHLSVVTTFTMVLQTILCDSYNTQMTEEHQWRFTHHLVTLSDMTAFPL